MPLSHGKSQKSFVKNLKTELEHGKPKAQSLAIAYAMKRKAQHKADGGPVLPGAQSAQDSMRKAFKMSEGGCPACGYSDGGEVAEEDAGKVSFEGDDMVGRIMSKGGKVANDTHPFEADFEDPNEFDDLVLRDDLSSSYGEDDNAGDELGDKQEDEDRKDIVSRIMKSRSKKDHNPRPA